MYIQTRVPTRTGNHTHDCRKKQTKPNNNNKNPSLHKGHFSQDMLLDTEVPLLSRKGSGDWAEPWCCAMRLTLVFLLSRPRVALKLLLPVLSHPLHPYSGH